jgi:hypothetical protein
MQSSHQLPPLHGLFYRNETYQIGVIPTNVKGLNLDDESVKELVTHPWINTDLADLKTKQTRIVTLFTVFDDTTKSTVQKQTAWDELSTLYNKMAEGAQCDRNTRDEERGDPEVWLLLKLREDMKNLLSPDSEWQGYWIDEDPTFRYGDTEDDCPKLLWGYFTNVRPKPTQPPKKKKKSRM